VHSGGRSSTGELLINFCYIFTVIGVVTFTIYFSLQEKYKEEVVKKHDEGFNYEEDPIDGRAVYDNRGGKAHIR
jgi:lipopolysaccharide export system protein LptC